MLASLTRLAVRATPRLASFATPSFSCAVTPSFALTAVRGVWPGAWHRGAVTATVARFALPSDRNGEIFFRGPHGTAACSHIY